MKLNWFIRKGLFYYPITAIGWFILTATVVFAVYTFIGINATAHSVSDVLINFIFNLLIIGLAYTLMAFMAEKKPSPTNIDDK